MKIEEDFNSDPTTRGWVKKGVGLDWDSVNLRAGGRFYFNAVGSPNAYVHAMDPKTDASDDLVLDMKLTFLRYEISWSNAGFGFFNSTNSRRQNSVLIFCTRDVSTEGKPHRLMILAYDSAGNNVASAFVPNVFFPNNVEANVITKLTYNPISRQVALDVYDMSMVLLGSSYLTLPGTFPFVLNECGARTQDHSDTSVYCVYYMDDFSALLMETEMVLKNTSLINATMKV